MEDFRLYPSVKMTRGSAARQKSLKAAIQGLCTSMFQEAEDNELGADQVVALYVKLVSYRQQLREINEELLQTSSDLAADFAQAENFDRRCLEECEKLHARIPQTHSLVQSNRPVHLKQNPAPSGGGDQAVTQMSSDSRFLKKPKLEEFDGKNAMWPLWKSVFEKAVHDCADLSPDAKFFHLVSAIRKGCFAHRLVTNYVGIENAYNLAWKDLNKHYESTSNLKAVHMRALRDVRRKFRVDDAKNFGQLENLHQAVWGHVNALRAQGIVPTAYESLALLGIEEALPRELRAKFFATHEPTEDSHLGLEMILLFVEKEARSQRRSWEVDSDRMRVTSPKRDDWKNTKAKSRGDGRKAQDKAHDRKKHSSMAQIDSQSKENVPSEDLN